MIFSLMENLPQAPSNGFCQFMVHLIFLKQYKLLYFKHWKKIIQYVEFQIYVILHSIFLVIYYTIFSMIRHNSRQDIVIYSIKNHLCVPFR